MITYIEIFLFCSLFFPRIVLFIAWMTGSIPSNNVPLFFDLFGAIIIPRFLIMYYIIHAELGAGWLIAHIIALIIQLIIDE